MSTFQKQFVNELGNHIHIEVSRKEIEGIDGVLISISGPNSISENHITRQEAEVLLEQLKLLLQK